MKNYIVKDSRNKTLFELQVSIHEPIQIIICKDRQTKQNYLMFRTMTDNSLTAPKMVAPVPFCQYDGIQIEEKK